MALSPEQIAKWKALAASRDNQAAPSSPTSASAAAVSPSDTSTGFQLLSDVPTSGNGGADNNDTKRSDNNNDTTTSTRERQVSDAPPSSVPPPNAIAPMDAPPSYADTTTPTVASGSTVINDTPPAYSQASSITPTVDRDTSIRYLHIRHFILFFFLL
jgi:hypothetical protein